MGFPKDDPEIMGFFAGYTMQDSLTAFGTSVAQ
jgi:hypothetical protein